MPQPSYPVREAHGFRFIDEGPASGQPPIVLLHGMLGDLSNWTDTVSGLAEQGYRALVPVLPVYDLPLRQTSVDGLVQHVRAFASALALDPAVLVGNSLGGQVALFYALGHPDAVTALVLSGASGIYERRMGSSTMKRQDPEYIRERAAVTFYDSSHATDELVDEMYELVNDRARALRLIKMARSSKKATVTDRLSSIHQPTLLVWGRDDEITPPDVAERFQARLPNAQLHLVDRCGHAPMLEQPAEFNRRMLQFLRDVTGETTLSPAGTPKPETTP